MRGEIARGAAWMVLFRLVDRSIGIISTAFLARLLVPADFGLVAMAMSVIALIELATAFSFEVALIQKDDPQREHFDTAWTLNIIVAAVGAIATSASAYPAAAFYGDPRLVPVMFAIGAAWFVSGFENVGIANFRRSMNFAAEFRLLASKRMIAFVVTLAAAVTFRSYWALVVGMATGRMAGVLLSYALQPFRPRLSLACSRELFSFSGWLLANNIAIVVLGRVPHFFVGRIFGAQALGAYTVGSEISQLAHTELAAPISRALFPGYARLVGDLVLFRRTCIEATSAIMLIVVPISAGIALTAGPIVRILLGAQWSEAVPVVQVLAFAGAVAALTSNNVAVYVALGRPHLFTTVLLARLVLLVATIIPLSNRFGMLGAAYAELTASLSSLLVSVPILLVTLKLSPRAFASSLWRPLVASGVMAVCVRQVMQAVGGDGSLAASVIELVAGAATGALTFAVLVWALWQASGRPAGVERLFAERLLAMLARHKAAVT